MNIFAIKPRQLQIFITLADCGSVTKTAELLALSQPAISMALKELEKQLGELFSRDNGHLKISARGKECLPLAREIIGRLKDLKKQSQKDKIFDEIYIGASNTVGNYLVGSLLKNFIYTHPETKINLRVNNTLTVVNGILNFSLDFGCVEGEVRHPKILQILWKTSSLVACVSCDHPLSEKKESLKYKDLVGANWILREKGSAIRRQSEYLLRSLPKGKVLLELGQIEAIKQATIEGLGVAFLPRIAVKEAVRDNKLVLLNADFLCIRRPINILLRKSHYYENKIDAFLESLNLKIEPVNSRP